MPNKLAKKIHDQKVLAWMSSTGDIPEVEDIIKLTGLSQGEAYSCLNRVKDKMVEIDVEDIQNLIKARCAKTLENPDVEMSFLDVSRLLSYIMPRQADSKINLSGEITANKVDIEEVLNLLAAANNEEESSSSEAIPEDDTE